MVKASLTFICLLFSFTCFAQEDTIRLVPHYKQKGFLQLDYQSIKMPDGERNMGFSGVHYNLDIGKLFYSGFGFYGSVSGERGGFFTLGVNAGLKTKLINNLLFDAGVHLGGGGGASAPDGGGAMFLGHANLVYQFPKFDAFAGYGYVNFFDVGAIRSNHLNFGIRVPLCVNYTDFSNIEQRISYQANQQTPWNRESKKLGIMLHFNNLSPKGKSKTTDGNSLDGKTMRLVGVEINSYFNKNNFFFAKADGGYSGIRGGYMDILLGAGHQFSFNADRTAISAKFGIGAGGGGGVDTKGGFLIYPDLSLTHKIHKNFNIQINKGFLMTPNSEFYSSTFGIGLLYNVGQGGFKYNKGETFEEAVFKGLEITAAQEIYFKAKREAGSVRDMQQILLQLNYYINKHIFLAGQTAFANFGDAGAYAEGTFGIGASTGNKFKAFGQVLAGGSGGGGIDVGEGLIIKPSVGLQYQLLPVLDLKSSVGRVKAVGGNLSNTFANIGLTYKIALLEGR
jgi:hypothetical protein